MKLSKALEITNPEDFKFHAARDNGKVEPLNVFLSDKAEWHNWNAYQGSKNEFNRPYILSFVKFYPEPETWLYAGAYKVLSRGEEKHTHSYNIELAPIGVELIGRLKMIKALTRGRAFKLETIIDSLEVSEILKEPYTGEMFSGFENISYDFGTLEIIFKNNRPDWQSGLESVKGVYVICDKKTGKKYVGSAYGENGIWSRWQNYMNTGHGWNRDLVGLLDGEGLDYARENFRMTLIECWPFKTNDDLILARETFWKNALLTRGDFGYNAN